MHEDVFRLENFCTPEGPLGSYQRALVRSTTYTEITLKSTPGALEHRIVVFLQPLRECSQHQAAPRGRSADFLPAYMLDSEYFEHSSVPDAPCSLDPPPSWTLRHLSVLVNDVDVEEQNGESSRVAVNVLASPVFTLTSRFCNLIMCSPPAVLQEQRLPADAAELASVALRRETAVTPALEVWFECDGAYAWQVCTDNAKSYRTSGCICLFVLYERESECSLSWNSWPAWGHISQCTVSQDFLSLGVLSGLTSSDKLNAPLWTWYPTSSSKSVTWPAFERGEYRPTTASVRSSVWLPSLLLILGSFWNHAQPNLAKIINLTNSDLVPKQPSSWCLA